MIIYLLWFAALAAIILAAYWFESTPWRYCRRCGYYWNKKTNRSQNYCPRECDGIVRIEDCPQCEREIKS